MKDDLHFQLKNLFLRLNFSNGMVSDAFHQSTNQILEQAKAELPASLSEFEQEKYLYEAFLAALKLGEITAALEDKWITMVSISDFGKQVLIEREGTITLFASVTEYGYAEEITKKIFGEVYQGKSLLSGQMPFGIRVHLIPWIGFVPAALTFRKAGWMPYFNREKVDFLSSALQAGKNILIVGEPATGKTTLAHQLVQSAGLAANCIHENELNRLSLTLDKPVAQIVCLRAKGIPEAKHQIRLHFGLVGEKLARIDAFINECFPIIVQVGLYINGTRKILYIEPVGFRN